MDAAALVHELDLRHPPAARLARWACLPVRISPAFLRLARLRLEPGAGTGDEADLWLSDLVESRSGAGFALRRGVREHLRDLLRQDARALDRLWQTVHLEHAPWLTPRGRLEEELTWRLLRDAADPAIEALWAGVLSELDAGPNAEGVARWVARAVPDLPPGTLEQPNGRRAYHGAHLLLGDASVLGADPQEFADVSELAFATRRLPRRHIHVGLTHDGLLVSPLQPIVNGHEIEVPDTKPLWLQIEGDSDVDRFLGPKVLTFDGLAPLHQVLDPFEPAGPVDLRSIDGALHRLARQAARPSATPTSTAPARVEIEYEVELNGATKKVHLPFVVGVLADLSGQPIEPLPPLADRKFLSIDIDNFDARIKALMPRLTFAVDNVLDGEGMLKVDIRFKSLSDWAPASVMIQVDYLQNWQLAAVSLDDLADALRDGKVQVDGFMRLLADRDLIYRLNLLLPNADTTAAESDSGTAIRDEVGHMLGIEDPMTRDIAYSGAEVMARVARVDGEAALAFPDLLKGLREASGRIVRRVGTQLDHILHHPDFQRLEGAWRGLHHLVSQTETDEMLKIRVLNVGKDELARSLRRAKGPEWDQGVLFKKVYEEEYGQFGGEPYGLLVGDYEFDHRAVDVELLQSLSLIAAASHAPFLAAVSPRLLQIDRWEELDDRVDLQASMATPEYAAWASLRQSEDSRYLGLAMPPVLARQPYGRVSHPVPSLDYEEDVADGDRRLCTWANPAYAMAANVTRAFKRYRWCSAIRGVEGGGAVLELPAYNFGSRGGTSATPSPTGIAIDARRESALADLGLMALMTRGPVSAFISANSLQQPAHYDDPDATANAALAARWPYLFACCRFMHYLKCIARDRIGSYRTPEDLQSLLNHWILQYVDTNPAVSTETMKARRPLAQAQVAIETLVDRPGQWTMKAYLRPHYQLEGLTVSLRLVAAVPGA